MENYNRHKTIDTNNPSGLDNKKGLWLAFISSIIFYNVIAISISTTEENFQGNGFIEIENNVYFIMFIIFLLLSFVQFVIIFKINSKDENKTLKLSRGKENYFWGLKIAMANVIAIYGITLFLINGNFNHLLLFTGLGLSGMFYIYFKEFKK